MMNDHQKQAKVKQQDENVISQRPARGTKIAKSFDYARRLFCESS